jgi:outer membrane protein TolC
VTLRVAEAYMESLRDGELVRLAEETLAQMQNILDRTRLRLKSGVGQGADRARLSPQACHEGARAGVA